MKKATVIKQGWLLPLLVSFTGGVITFVLVSVIVGVMGAAQRGYLGAGAVMGCIVWWYTWMDLSTRHTRHMMRVQELTVTPPPVMQPVLPAQYTPKTPQTRLEIIRHDEGGNVVEGEFHDFFEDRDTLREVAEHVLTQGQPLSGRSLVGPSRVFESNADFETFANNLIRYNLAEWRKPGYPNQGRRLTRLGERVFRGQLPHSPTLLESGEDENNG